MIGWIFVAFIVIGVVCVVAVIVAKVFQIGRAANHMISRNDPKSTDYRQ